MNALTAVGPLRQMGVWAIGDPIVCWAGVGTIELVHAPFNGVQGIRAYASIRLADGSTCSEAIDQLRVAEADNAIPDGMLW